MLGGVIYWGFERTRKRIVFGVKRIGGWDVIPWKNVAQKEADVENTAETVTVVEGSLPAEVWVRFFRELLSSAKKTRKETPVLMQRVNLLST